MPATSVKKAAAIACFAALVVLATGCGGSASTSTSAPVPGSGTAGVGTRLALTVPPALRRLPLTNQRGETVQLSLWRGKTILLVPFLSLCQDICPMTTGNLLTVEQSLRADHAAGDVEIVELSVDPGRDTPARLAAYAKLTDATWQLVTEPSRELRRLARFFGFYYQKVAEDDPGARDWWSGRRLTYDVDHSDNYFVIDPNGIERVEQDAAPAFRGQLNPKLYKFLNAPGRQHLDHAPQPDWTPVDALQALAMSVGRPLPVAVS